MSQKSVAATQMKCTCPHCEQVFKVPAKAAGKKVRCPGCQLAVEVPVDGPEAADSSGGLDLNMLNAIEQGGQTIIREKREKPLTLKEAQAVAAAARKKPQTTGDPTIRVCPKCEQQIHSPDLYGDIICRHCGTAIPGMEIEGDTKVRYQDSMANRIKMNATFYNGFTSAALYPIPAAGHISLAMALALGIIAVPLLGILGFMGAANLNELTAKKADYGWVGIVITILFIAEGIYFGAVAYYAMIDTIRATTAGAEQAPGLTWNVINLGAALGGYVVMIGAYVLIAMLLVLVANGTFPTSMQDLSVLMRPVNLGILALITFVVPMNLIGLSSGHALDGLNPAKVGQSIFKVLGHYVFLFLIMLLLTGIYIAVMAGLMSWAGPIILSAASSGIGKGLFQMLIGLLAWAVVIGAGFYFAYSLGRVLGLFSRTYREHIQFEL